MAALAAGQRQPAQAAGEASGALTIDWGCQLQKGVRDELRLC